MVPQQPAVFRQSDAGDEPFQVCREERETWVMPLANQIFQFRSAILASQVVFTSMAFCGHIS